MKPRLLDLFSCQGGAAMGYHRAGFEVVGVDIVPQPKYPFPFILGNALDILSRMMKGEKFLATDGNYYGIDDFDAIHASPPCQEYSVTRYLKTTTHLKLIEPVRELLQKIGKPYVIENVPGAPLNNPLVLCGSMFGLRVYRHRLFETNPAIYFPPAPCNHWAKASGNKAMKKDRRITPNLKDFDILTVVGHDFIVSDASIAMGIDWMGQHGLSQAIPPAYTEYIGRHFLAYIEQSKTF